MMPAERLPGRRFAEAQTDKNPKTNHPVLCVRLWEMAAEYGVYFVLALRVGPRRSLGRRPRSSALPVPRLQTHLQHPDQHSARAVAQPGTLAHLRGNDVRGKEHPGERHRVRGERGDFLPLAPAVHELHG